MVFGWMRLVATLSAVAGAAPGAVPPDCATLPERPPAIATALASCLGCHQRSNEGPRTLEELDRALCLRSPALVERMIGRAAREEPALLDEATIEMLRERQRELHAAKPTDFDIALPRIQIAEKEPLDVLPLGDRTDPGGYFLEWLKARGAVFYDATSLTKARQIQPVGARMSVEDLFRMVFPRLDSRTNQKYADRGGLEFPWEKPAGVDLAPSIRTFTYFVPPETGPMVRTFYVGRKHEEMYSEFANENDMLYGYDFLPGTAFLEVLAVVHGEQTLPIEVRVRAVDANGAWYFDVLRPFPTRSALATELHVRYPEARRPENVSALLQAVELPAKESLRTVALTELLPAFWQRRNSEATKVLESKALVHRLPPLDAATWAELLDRAPFRSAMGLAWFEATEARGEPLVGYAPESDEAVHFAPKGYFGSHLKTTSSQCVKCHSDTQYSVRRFSPLKGVLVTPGSSAAREWYGHMPGSTPQEGTNGLGASGIFSFHPFDADSILTTSGQTKTVRFDRRLAGAGLLHITGDIR